MKDPLINEIDQSFLNDTENKRQQFLIQSRKGYSYSHTFIRKKCPSFVIKDQNFPHGHMILLFFYTGVWSIKT